MWLWEDAPSSEPGLPWYLIYLEGLMLVQATFLPPSQVEQQPGLGDGRGNARMLHSKWMCSPGCQTGKEIGKIISFMWVLVLGRNQARISCPSGKGPWSRSSPDRGPAGARGGQGGSGGLWGRFPVLPVCRQAGPPLPELNFHALEKPTARPGALWALEKLEQPLC